MLDTGAVQGDPRDHRLVEQVDAAFVDAVTALTPLPAPAAGLGRLTPQRVLELFESQATSRHLDLAARWLRLQDKGFYTIGSSGHEGNAAVAAALRPTDPALLHYRSGAFYVERARQVPGVDAVRDVLLGLVAAADDPISGGRHKVFGRHELAVVPQTSTIASHLPRALGTAFSLDRATKLGVDSGWPAGSVVVASFGDASANHSTATGAVNAAAHVAQRGIPVPLLLVCEDNGLGISVPTPSGWVEQAYGHRPGLRYEAVDGSDLVAATQVADDLVAWVRRRRRPAFLHLRTVRLMGHAGSDLETGYRTPAEIAADLARDPLVSTARLLVVSGTATPDEVLARYEAVRDRVAAVAVEVADAPRLTSAATVMSTIAPRRPDDVAGAVAARVAAHDRRTEVFGGALPEDAGGLTLAQHVNRTLLDALAADRGVVVLGEDVARKGGVYGVTRGLQRRAGPARVFDTLLDEQTVLGIGLGAALCGLLPVTEIQYLAYLHNAEDQLRGEGATLPFFSAGRYRNPMVVRVAGYGYQKGFGGHFHNDDAVAVLRDVPGLVVASPSRPEDAGAVLRTLLAAGRVDGTLSVLLEPIALYHSRDLHEPGDGLWAAPYPSPSRWADEHVPIGSARTHGDGADLSLVTFANGVPMSLRVARRLEARGIGVRVVDLRWLAPLPVDDVLREARATGTVLVVDETRRSGGVSEGVLAALVDHGFAGRMARVTSEDSFVPLGDAALTVLLQEQTVERAALDLLGRTGG